MMTRPQAIFAIGALLGAWVLFQIGKIEGRHEVMTSTVVRLSAYYGVPYFGPYFGTCARYSGIEACATLAGPQSLGPR